jgi:hypothetical protein
MDYLHELNAVGRIVGNGGPNSIQHSRSTFANTDSQFKPIRSSEEIAVPSFAIDFSTTLVAGSDLMMMISTHILKEDGTIFPTDNESWDVGDGSVKFSISVKSSRGRFARARRARRPIKDGHATAPLASSWCSAWTSRVRSPELPAMPCPATPVTKCAFRLCL